MIEKIIHHHHQHHRHHYNNRQIQCLRVFVTCAALAAIVPVCWVLSTVLTTLKSEPDVQKSIAPRTVAFACTNVVFFVSLVFMTSIAMAHCCVNTGEHECGHRCYLRDSVLLPLMSATVLHWFLLVDFWIDWLSFEALVDGMFYISAGCLLLAAVVAIVRRFYLAPSVMPK